MTIVTFNQLSKIREENLDKKIVFCSGCFDLTHAGHIIFFENCKKLGDILIVSVGSDKLLKKYKGDLRPILNETIRLKNVDSLKPVDYCLLEPYLDKEDYLQGLEPLLKKLSPDIYVINDDASNKDYREGLCKKYRVSLRVLERHCPPEFENISTTKIIEKIKSII